MLREESARRSRWIVAATIAAALAALSVQLFVPPTVGLADNGDFSRVTVPAGLAHESERPEDRYFGWMQPRFRHVARAADLSGYRTSQTLLVEAALAVSRLARPSAFFDIRFLAAVHIALLLAALAALVWACRDLALSAQAAAAALLVFSFTDAGYVAPFNSMYSQTASFLFLMLVAACGAIAVRRGELRGLLLLAYFLGAALFVTSKPQEIPQAPLLALFAVRLAWPAGRRTRGVALALAVLLCALGLRYYRSAEGSVGWVTNYHVLFMEILPNSPDPARDLAELGLDPALARFADTSPWVPGSPASDPAVRAYLEGRTGRPSPRLLYLRHPDRVARLLVRTARASYVLRPDELGNFAKESGAPAGSKSRAPWSTLRRHLTGAVSPALLFGGTLLTIALTYRHASDRGKRFREGLAILVLMAGGAFVIVAIGDTPIETARHLYTFHALCDLILIADAAWLTQAIANGRHAAGPRAA